MTAKLLLIKFSGFLWIYFFNIAHANYEERKKTIKKIMFEVIIVDIWYWCKLFFSIVPVMNGKEKLFDFIFKLTAEKIIGANNLF